jgi:type I restriction enzyme, S subunit
VAKLDALSAKSARARTELARIETLVSRYKQAVLSKAFSGELTSDVAQADDVATIDADASVAQLWSLPDTWSWCRTDQVGRVGLGRQRSPKNHQGPQMRPYLRSANITWQGVNTSDVNEMNFDDADFKRFKLEVGDVLLNEGSGSAKEVGKPAIWRGEIADCCYQNTLLRVQPHHCSSEYAYYYFLLTARAGRFVSSTQGVNIQHIGREGLACYPFPLAPEPEQHEIVRRIESAFSKIDRLAKEAKRALELVGRLDEAILAKAFRGELVPQDQNDEPAERLLARIRAERETAPKVKRGRGRSI